MNKELGLVIPSSSPFWSFFFYFPGCFLYHLIYMKQMFSSTYETTVSGPRILSKNMLKKKFPDLRHIHGQYGVLMYETQTLDSRQTLHSLLTSSIDNYIPGMKGATLANYVELTDFIKGANGKIEGAVLFDKIKKKEYRVKSKVVVNCTGIFADSVRTKDNSEARPRLMGARGTHIMFPQHILP
jgi:glycerol-3-phosphate dehydrogenase